MIATIVLDALHADQVLNRAGDAEREVQLRRDRLPGAADLALHRQPAGVADRPRRRELGAERLGQLLRERQMFACSLMPRPTDDDPLGLRQVDRLLRFLERRLGLLADRRRRRPSTASARTGAGDAPLRRLVGAERADLERDEVRRRPLRHDVGGQLALEHRPHERASSPPPLLTPVTSVTSARSSRAASFGAKSRV